MHSAATIRLQIEAALAQKIPAALSPAARVVRPVAGTGIRAIDEPLDGGLPLGAITEITGEESSGRSTLALSYIGRRTREGKVCAWIDASNALRPESAAAAGVDLGRLLWVRCGVAVSVADTKPKAGFQLPQECLVPPQPKKGLYAGGWGAHPRSEVKGLSAAMGSLFGPENVTPRYAESKEKTGGTPPAFQTQIFASSASKGYRMQAQKPWVRLDQALRVADLLLLSGGFSAIVLDMGSIAPEYSSRVPLATWFRYRAAAERSQASILLLTQYPCAKNSAGLVLRLRSSDTWHDETTVFTGLQFETEVGRQRFAPASNGVPLRKGPQRETGTTWSNRCSWAGRK
jgi:recombination protein RecA